MKKILISLVVIAVAVGAGIYLFKNTPTVTQLKNSVTSSLASTVPGIETLESLPPTTLAASYVVGPEIKKTQDTIAAYFEKMRSTEVWKSLGLDAQLANIKQQILDNLDSSAGGGSELSISKSVESLWNALNGGFKFLSSSIDAKDTTVTLQYQLVLNTADQKNIFIDTMSKLLKASPGKVEQGDATTTTVRFGSAPNDALLSLSGSGDTTAMVSMLVSGVDTTGITSLQPDERKKILTLAGLENTAGYYVVKQNSFNKLMPNVLKKLSESAFPELAASIPAFTAKLENAEDVDTAASVISFSPAIRSKTCATTATATVPIITPADATATLNFISSRSPGFAAITTANILSYLKTALATAKATDSTKEDKQAAQDIEAIEQAFDNLHLTNVAALSIVPINGATPHYGFAFMASQPLNVKDFTAQLGGGLSALKARYPEEKIPTVKQSSDSAIALDLGNGSDLEGRVISPTIILFTQTPAFFDEVGDMLKRDKPFISADRISASGVGELLKDPALVVYLSTSSLMPLAKQFAPFLSMLNPKAHLSDKDYNEFLSLVEFSGLYAESAPTITDNITCSVSGIGLLKGSYPAPVAE